MIEMFLNRLRGTGDIFNISKFAITGTMLYALYILIVSGILIFSYNLETNTLVNYILSLLNISGYDLAVTNIFYAVSAVMLFLLGESYAFGKWVGFLVDYEDEHTPEYDSKVGKGFPYIHYIANYIVDERVDYKRYCQVALAIRGLFWWLPLYLLFAYIGFISYVEAMLLGIAIGIGFPVAAYVGRNWDYNNKIGVLEFKRGWENQEIVYGLFQGIALWYVIISNIIK